MRRSIAVLAVACVLLLGGCADGVEELYKSDTSPSATEKPVDDESDDQVVVELSKSHINGTDMDVWARKLPDGRWVTCIVLGSGDYGSGIDCDWEGASTQCPAQ
ncbi:hypothetical protein [Ornithinimicrobium murale]|uniref:hypothetical protein n=1 Tax=Ornithinimicrobium murale TaxID=1050153 RepID=UPI0013B46E46|nr:hypothetical protein [Ornithinimicrobium murale]